MLAQRLLCVLVLSGLAACGGSGGSPAAPQPPAPPRFSLAGTLIDSATQAAPSGGRVEIVDGVNQGRVAAADGEGR
jgi:hypothetical protein